MSALGQKQTFAVHQPMSALPPKADIRVLRTTERVRPPIAADNNDYRRQQCCPREESGPVRPAVIGGWTVPMWLSWIGLVVAGGLSYFGMNLAMRG
jgi:hypothetical protein